jgi:hypothetical protein
MLAVLLFTCQLRRVSAARAPRSECPEGDNPCKNPAHRGCTNTKVFPIKRKLFLLQHCTTCPKWSAWLPRGI